MTAYAASEVRMHLDTAGRVRATHPAAGYEYWKPFAESFQSVVVLARVETHVRSDAGVLVEGPGVSVRALPYYHGLIEAPAGTMRVRRRLRSLGTAHDIFIVRLPELVSAAVHDRARSLGARVVTFVVAEPRSLYRGLLPGPVGRIVGASVARSTTRRVATSDAVLYVSDGTLQALYPARQGVPTMARSNVRLSSGDFVAAGRTAPLERPLRLISVGTAAHKMKGFDTLINVAEALREQGIDAETTIVGGGRWLEHYRGVASNRAVAVNFVGHIDARERIVELLDGADVYVSASRSEGLPRATIEAMARGLPVVTTRAGASGELVPRRFTAPIGDAEAIAKAIKDLAHDPGLYEQASQENLIRAAELADRANPARLTEFLVANFGASSDETRA